MNQIREVAMAYYARSTAGEKLLAEEFFRSLDADGDGRVSLAEYKNVVGSSVSSNKFFDQLDQNGDGTLDFEEVLSLYYLGKIGLRQCDICGVMLLGSYFSCLMCEMNSSYDLCCGCYGGGHFNHHHSTANFIDDRSMRLLLVQFMKQADTPRPPARSSSSTNYAQRSSSGSQFNWNAPPTHRKSKGEKVKSAFEAFNSSISVGNSIVSIGSFAVQSGCSVM